MKKARVLFCIAAMLYASTGLATSYVLQGSSISANLAPWGGQGHVYPLAFDVTAPGGIDIIFYDVDGSLMRFNNIGWGGSLAGTGLTGVTAGESITSIDPPNNSVWSNTLNQNTPGSSDWAGNPTSTLGPDGIPLTMDDTRSWLHQSWYRPMTGPKTGHPGYGDPAYNTESYVTPNNRFPSAPANSPSFYNTFDLRIRITHNGAGNYTAERWVRMHNSAATVEGAYWVYNAAVNNSADAWRRFENEAGIYTFPMSSLDLTSVHPFVAVGNWETAAIQGIIWGNVVVTGTPALQAEVWVDDDWTGLPNGTTVILPGGGTGYVGYNAFAMPQGGIDAVSPGGIVHVEVGNYTGQLVINKSLSLSGDGSPVIQAPAGSLLSYRIPESGARFEPVILAYGGVIDGARNISGAGTIQVTLSGIQIDGNNKGSVNRFCGILFRNCLSSTISYSNLYELLFSSGNPETFGILIYGNSNVLIDHNTVNDFSRNGITANGDYGPLPDPVAAISNNVVVGEGPLPLGHWAQNGIQIGFGASGSIIGNDVSEVSCLDPNWAASGIVPVLAGSGMIISGNSVHNCQVGLYPNASDDLTINSDNIFNQNEFSCAFYGGDDIVIEGNTFTGSSYALWLTDVTNVTVTDNAFTGNGYGIIADGASASLSFSGNVITGNTAEGALVQPYGSSPTGVAFNGNNISGNGYGLENATANLVDATANWWGDASGPNSSVLMRSGSKIARPVVANPVNDSRSPQIQRSLPGLLQADANTAGPSPSPIILGSGDDVSAGVDYSPWWRANYVSDPHSTSWNWGVNTSNSSTIKEGIGIAASGDIIMVDPGTYSEADTITKSITLTGDRGDINVAGPGPSAPVLDGTGLSGAGAFWLAEDIDDVTIEGFEIRNYGPNGNTNADGVAAWNNGNANIVIRDNYFHHLGYAGVLAGNGWGGPQGLHSNWTISYNVVRNFAGYALDLENAENSQIANNLISDPSVITQGIMVLALADPGYSIVCSGNTVSGNTFTNFPDRAICLVTWAQAATSSATLQNLTVSGNSISGNYIAISPWSLGSGTNVMRNFAVNNNTIIINDPKASYYAADFTGIAGSNSFSGNAITLSGTLQPGAAYFHGLNIGGAATGSWTIDDCQFDGNNLGSSNVGIRLRSTLPSSAVLHITNCTIAEFARGIRSDALAGGTLVDVEHSSLASNTEYGLYNGVGAQITADHNWWGSYCGPFNPATNPDGQGTAVSDNVVYDPWCNKTFTRCDFSNGVPPTVLWVDDNYTPTGANDGHFWCYDAFASIGGGLVAVAPGGTVNIGPGLYEEQVVINKAGLTIIGSGAGSDPVSNTVIKSPTTLTYYFTTSAPNYPVIGFDGVSGASIRNCRIDGAGRGNTNYRFIGIGFWNAGGLVTNCHITGIQDTPFSGAQHGVGIYAYNNTGGPYTVNVTGTQIADCQKNAMALSGNGLTANVTGCTVSGRGPTGVTAQNGIQIGYGANGSVSGNEAHSFVYAGPGWSASGIILVDPSPGVTLSSNNVHDCQGGLNAYGVNNLVMNNSNVFDQNDFNFILGGNGAIINGNTFSGNSEGLYFAGARNATTSGNSFVGNGYAIVMDSSCVNLAFTGNAITGNTTVGVLVQPWILSPTGVAFHGNNISENAQGIENVTANMVQASGNWWGDIAGPTVTTRSSHPASAGHPLAASILDSGPEIPSVAGSSLARPIDISGTLVVDASAKSNPADRLETLTSGDGVSLLVDYSPWWGQNYVGDPHSSAWNWYLDTSNSSSIQEAVNIATSGDSVFVLADKYSGSGNREIDFGGKNIRLFSVAGPDSTIIDCENAGRAFHFHSGETSAAVVNGFTIKRGSTTGNGGAILFENASRPRISYCLIVDNQANGHGGAIYCGNSGPGLTNNTIFGNRAMGIGGGIYVANSSPAILNTIFWQDTASAAPEIQVDGGSPSITFCDIRGGWSGEGNLNCDPRFCDADNSDFGISDISCCLTGGYGGTHIGAYDLGCAGDFLPGDANADGKVNGLDVVYMVNYFKDIGPPFPPPIWRADANGNCNVNGIDVVYLVNYLMGQGPAPLKGNCIGVASAGRQPSDLKSALGLEEGSQNH